MAVDSVMACNYRQWPKWLPRTVAEVKGPLPYVVQLESGLLWQRHIQLRDSIQTSTEALVNIPPKNTARTSLDDATHTSLEDAAHASLDDTVDPSDNTNEPVVASQPVSDATENENPAEAHRELIMLLISV